jgi:hypothetical protein
VTVTATPNATAPVSLFVFEIRKPLGYGATVDLGATASGSSTRPVVTVTTTIDFDLLLGYTVVQNTATSAFQTIGTMDDGHGNTCCYLVQNTHSSGVDVPFFQGTSGTWVETALALGPVSTWLTPSAAAAGQALATVTAAARTNRMMAVV